MSPQHHSSTLVLWGPYVIKNYLTIGTTIPHDLFDNQNGYFMPNRTVAYIVRLCHFYSPGASAFK